MTPRYPTPQLLLDNGAVCIVQEGKWDIYITVMTVPVHLVVVYETFYQPIVEGMLDVLYMETIKKQTYPNSPLLVDIVEASIDDLEKARQN